MTTNAPEPSLPFDDETVEGCLDILKSLSRENDQDFWAAMQVSLGNAYLERDEGDPAQNAEDAIAAFLRAAEVRSPLSDLEAWSDSLILLGFAYVDRIMGDPLENLTRAITTFTEILQATTPEEFPYEWAGAQIAIGDAYSDRTELSPIEHREKAIRAYEKALEILPREEAPEEWAATMLNLGNVYSERLRGDRADNLERAIFAYREALTFYTRDDWPDDWAQVKVALGTVLSQRLCGDRAENLEEAIGLFLQALEVHTHGAAPAAWAATTRALADVWCERLVGDRGENLEEAIRRYRQALEVQSRAADAEQWAGTLTNLGIAYGERFLGERAANLEEAIAAHKQALKVGREAAPETWALAMANLGNAYLNRFRGDPAENIERAIAACEQALEVYTRERWPPEWAETKVSLAAAYVSRLRGDQAGNLETAIAACEQALELLGRDTAPDQWAYAMNWLGNAYAGRLRGDRAENLEKALDAHQQALTVRTPGKDPLEWAATRTSLGNVYLARLHGNRAENLEQAIEAYRDALEVLTPEARPVEWATVKSNLGNAYSNRIRGDWRRNLEEAIRSYQDALKVVDRDQQPLEWGRTMSNLGTVYSERGRQGNALDLERAIEANQRALEVRTRETAPVDWATTTFNLAACWAERRQGDRAANFEKAIRAYRDALEVLRPETLPFLCRRAASQLGDAALETECWPLAVEAYGLAQQSTERLFRASLLQLSRGTELAEEPNVARHAAYALGRLRRWEEAVVTLERGRARGLGETLARERANLEALREQHPDLERRYREAVERLRELEILERAADRGQHRTRPADLHEWARRAWDDLNAAVEAVRQLPGHGDFLHEPEFHDVARVVEPGYPLAYLLTAPAGSLALIVHRSIDSGAQEVSILPVEVPDFDNEMLHDLLVKPPGKDDAVSYLDGQLKYPEALKNLLHTVLPEFGKHLIGPVAARLRELEAEGVVLVPGGVLGLLPLHAAPYQVDGTTRILLDELEVSYAPSARVLGAARAALAGQRLESPTLVGIANPLPHARPLAYASAELEEVAGVFDEPERHTFHGVEATRGAFESVISRARYLHLACHATFRSHDPLSSRLELASGEFLTLGEISDQRLEGMRLVTLSACQTALTEFESLPDEMIGLPAGFLEAGAAGVVANLWQVDDLSTALLVGRFYRYHLHGDPASGASPMAPAAALRKAQQWLRRLTVNELMEEFRKRRRTASEGDPPSGHRAFEEIAPQLMCRFVYRDPDARPFASPYYWASFVFLGT